MTYEINHKTSYGYSGPVSHCHSKLWLEPRNLENQTCQEVIIKIEPEPSVNYKVQDFYGNHVRYFAIQQSHKNLVVNVKSIVNVLPKPSFNTILPYDISWEKVKDLLSGFHHDFVDVYHFKYESHHVVLSRELYQYANLSFPLGRGLLAGVNNLMTRVYTDFKFVSGHTTISTPLEVIMKSKKGVCQDFAHLCIAFLRSHGLAARYVSGYIETLPPPGKKKLVGTDASHAWVSVYLPGYGWVDFDPTNKIFPSDQHIVLAWGRDFSDVSPMKGIVISTGKQTLQVQVDVKRIN